MPRETVKQTLFVATALCVVCSVLVSGAAVILRPWQVENRELDKKKNILRVAGLYSEDVPVDEAFKAIQPVLIDIESGKPVAEGEVDLETYDPRKAAADPALSVPIPADKDLAGIKRREPYAYVYEVVKDGKLEQIILPIYGKGLWSTLYGFIALEADGTTIRGITFYEHGETPGLGGEVDNPKWKAQWDGKQAFENGEVAIRVIKGHVEPGAPDAEHQVDGLSGATITSRGVSSLVKYWLGEHGFGPFLQSVRAKEGQHG